jgi:hypothetical protein
MPSSAAAYLAGKVIGVDVLTVPVVYGAVQARGHFRQDTAVADDGTGTVLTEDRSVLVRTGALGTVTRGSAITVDGLAYQVRDALRDGDGTLTRIILARAA